MHTQTEIENLTLEKCRTLSTEDLMTNSMELMKGINEYNNRVASWMLDILMERLPSAEFVKHCEEIEKVM